MSLAADIVYRQPHNLSGGLFQSSWQEPNGNDADQYVWDDFTLQSTQVITQVQWRGGFDPLKSGSGGPVLDFTVAIYASIAGGTQPAVNSPPLIHYLAGGNAGQTAAGTFGGTPMYDYAFTLPDTFTATAGTTYWVQIEAWQGGIPDWGIAVGSGGNGQHFRRMTNGSDIFYQTMPGDAAFTLLGPAVPIGSLSATNNSPTVLGQATTFTATVSAGSGVSYAWNFGDQAADSGQVVPHTYAALGSYTAVVTASNSLGSVTATTVVTITDVPIAGLSATNNSPTVLGQATTLTATISAGTNVSYAWNFGDQTAGSGQVVTHTYPHAGLFTATVTATNSVSGPATAITRITVTEAPITGLSATNDGPTLLGGITTLEASVASGTNVAYIWNSGDGQIRSGRVITHIYPATGSFTAIVTASNSASGPFTAATVVTITGVEIPVSGLVAANNSPTLWGSVTTLTASVASGSSVVYTWSLGDGQVGSGRVVMHRYPLGVYTAVVTASNSVNTLAASTVVTVTAPQHVYLPLTLKGVGSARGATRQSH